MGGNQLDVFWKIQPQRRCQENRLWFQSARLAYKTNTHQKMTTVIWKSLPLRRSAGVTLVNRSRAV
jgi:hypothetical protein